MISRILVCLFLWSSFGCSPPPGDKKLVNPNGKVVEEDGTSFQTDLKMDILFVIDDSPSMEKYQQKLIQGLNSFTDVFYQLDFIDYHIGVTTSSVYDFGGRLIIKNGVHYVERSTPDGEDTLRSMLDVGDNGEAFEHFFDIAGLALTEPLKSNENVGFLRDNALLVVIFLTDTDDQSRLTSQVFVDSMIKIKGGEENFMLATALIPSENATCERSVSEKKPIKIEAAAQIAKGFQFSICEATFGPELAKLAEKVFERISVIPLLRTPKVSTIRVMFGVQVIPMQYKTGWTYDPDENKIYLGSDIELIKQPGAKLTITFEEAVD